MSFLRFITGYLRNGLSAEGCARYLAAGFSLRIYPIMGRTTPMCVIASGTACERPQ